MIARYWKGVTSVETADSYLKHLEEDTFNKLNQIVGFREAKALKRNVEEGVEFIVISVWDSIYAIKQFAGDKYEMAVVPEIAKEYLLSYDTMVSHYEIALSA